MKRIEQICISDFHLPIKRFMKVIIAIIILFAGGLIYVIFRSDNLLMFSLFHYLGLDGIVIKLREGYGQMIIWDWVRYNMPAGLWLFSYMFIIDSIWNNSNSPAYKCFITTLPIIAIISEAMQFFHILPGTFDIRDMISYVFAISLFLIIKVSNK